MLAFALTQTAKFRSVAALVSLVSREHNTSFFVLSFWNCSKINIVACYFHLWWLATGVNECLIIQCSRCRASRAKNKWWIIEKCRERCIELQVQSFANEKIPVVGVWVAKKLVLKTDQEEVLYFIIWDWGGYSLSYIKLAWMKTKHLLLFFGSTTKSCELGAEGNISRFVMF